MAGVGAHPGSLLIAIWLAFAVTYSRGDASESFRRWRIAIAIACLLPVAALLGFRGDLIEVGMRTDAPQLWISFLPAGEIVNVANPGGHRSGADESRAHFSRRCRNNAVANQVSGSRAGGDFWGKNLHRQPGIGFFGSQQLPGRSRGHRSCWLVVRS